MRQPPVELICAICGDPFQKESREYRRQIKSGRSYFFCNLSCQAVDRNRKNPPKGNIQNLGLKRRRGNSCDLYTPYRWFLRIPLKRRGKNGGSDLTLSFLRDLWAQQKGICPLTGWNLRRPLTSNGWTADNPFHIDSASLDRIDNTKGYLQGNVRFVAVIANYARNVFTDADVVKFASAVVQRQTLAG